MRVSEKGVKTWLVRFRLGGKERKMALGAWPAITLADARKLAREARDRAAAGIDPRAERAAQKAAEAAQTEAEQPSVTTFADLARQFLGETAFRGETTAQEFAATVRLHLKPLAETPAEELHRSQLGDITAGLASPNRPGGPKPGAARKAYEAARRVTSWAVGRGKLEADPFAKMAPPAKGAPRARVLEDHELAIIWRAAAALGYPFGPMTRLLILTATRRNEAADMTWAELDDADAPTTWAIPADRSKNRLEHRIGLSPQARVLFESLPRFGAGPFIFSTRAGAVPVSGFTTAKRRLDRACANLNGGKPLDLWALHDLRRTARAGCALTARNALLARNGVEPSGDAQRRAGLRSVRHRSGEDARMDAFRRRSGARAPYGRRDARPRHSGQHVTGATMQANVREFLHVLRQVLQEPHDLTEDEISVLLVASHQLMAFGDTIPCDPEYLAKVIGDSNADAIGVAMLDLIHKKRLRLGRDLRLRLTRIPSKPASQPPAPTHATEGTA